MWSSWHVHPSKCSSCLLRTSGCYLYCLQQTTRSPWHLLAHQHSPVLSLFMSTSQPTSLQQRCIKYSEDRVAKPQVQVQVLQTCTGVQLEYKYQVLHVCLYFNTDNNCKQRVQQPDMQKISSVGAQLLLCCDCCRATAVSHLSVSRYRLYSSRMMCWFCLNYFGFPADINVERSCISVTVCIASVWAV